LEGIDRGIVVVLRRHFPGGTEEYLSGYLGSVPKLEPSTSLLQVQSNLFGDKSDHVIIILAYGKPFLRKRMKDEVS
jgi:hypothetical protein